MSPAKQLAWLILAATVGVAFGATLDREFSRSIEAQLKKATERVSQSW